MVTVLDAATNAIVTTIPVGNDPRAIASNFLLGEVYVSNTGSNSVSVINTTTNTVIATIPVGNSPLGMSSNDNLGKLYVASSPDNAIFVIDERMHTAKTIPVGKGPILGAVDGCQILQTNPALKSTW
jgi:YVTN family beta-propeller protein